MSRFSLLFWLLFAAVAAAVVFLGSGADVDLPFGIAAHDAARALLFGIVLVAVVAAVVGRGTFGQAVRHSVAWIAILVALVGAYSFRTEAEWVGRRLLAELLPGTAMVETPGAEGGPATVSVVRRAGGQFHVTGRINDMPVPMLVDTGASVVTLAFADAEAAGIDVDRLRFTVPVLTANGQTTAAPVIIDRLAVGSIERRRVPGLVARRGSLERSLLGMSFLNTLASYAITGDRLVMTP